MLISIMNRKRFIPLYIMNRKKNRNPSPSQAGVGLCLKRITVTNDCSTEIVVFNINEYVGRGEIMTVDAGDTIFVHMFGAYFGLAASR